MSNTMLSYIIWNGNPEIVSFELPFIDFTITLRWYGLLFALGFLISQQILYYIFKKEGKPEKDVDTLTIYMVIATIIGARLGHVLFYEPEKYISNPLDILKIWEGGLASHGAAVGILFALWLYAKKKFPGQNYLQTLDRIVILVALTGALIRAGNYFNSEIIGKPTKSDYGIVFARNVTEVLKNSTEDIADVSYSKADTAASEEGFMPAKILIEFTKTGNDIAYYETLMATRVNNLFAFSPYIRDHVHQDGMLDFTVSQDEDGTYYAIMNTWVVPRYPGQLYEAFSCVILFIALLWIWFKHQKNLPEGRLFGIFLIVCFGLRFVYEFYKENQVDFESNLPLNMGQILSIPLVLFGIYILWRSYQKKTVTQ